MFVSFVSFVCLFCFVCLLGSRTDVVVGRVCLFVWLVGWFVWLVGWLVVFFVCSFGGQVLFGSVLFG